jgi:putative Mn2+ efflux pump MntP
VGILPVIVIAVGLAMDATAVSLGAGASGRAPGRRAAFRLAFHFGLFQALMPLLGWLAGRGLAGFVHAVDHWIAFGLLLVVGGRMIAGGLRGGDDDSSAGDLSRGWSLVALSVATSIDAFAVGLGLAMLNVSIWVPVILIGVITAAMSVAGLLLGRVLSARWGHRAEIAGGVLLVGIGLQILVSHLR